MPLTERILKDAKGLLGDSLKYLQNGMRLPVIVTWPDFPSKKTTIHKIAQHLGFRLTNKCLGNPELILYFEDKTIGSSEALKTAYPERRILNADCTDISKEHTDAIHQRVFGYSTIIDPTKHQGDAVQKSSENALHDGRIIHCPVDRTEPGFVYQLVIDNRADENHVVDMRVPVIDGQIPHVYKKFKKNAVRFTNEVSYSELHETAQLLSSEEINQISVFAREMGADFCEVDVLRHASDGRIYIVDLNKTPYGPPAGLSKEDVEMAVGRLAALVARFARKRNSEA